MAVTRRRLGPRWLPLEARSPVAIGSLYRQGVDSDDWIRTVLWVAVIAAMTALAIFAIIRVFLS